MSGFGRRALAGGLPLALWALACGPLWRWWWGRFSNREELAAGALALGTAVALAVRNAARPDRAGVGPGTTYCWWGAAVALALFALTGGVLPMTVRGALALVAVLALPGPWWRAGLPDPAIAGVLALALPAAMMVELYLGYPLRLAASWLAAMLLAGTGLPVVRQGVELAWHDRVVWVDAPCAGVRMLWSGAWLAFAAAGVLRLNWRRTALAVASAGLIVVVANAARVALLCLAAGGVIPGAGRLHGVLGALLAALGATGVAAVVWRLAPRTTATPPRSTAPHCHSRWGRAGVCAFGCACLGAFLAQTCEAPPPASAAPPAGFPGWPAAFEGQPLRETPLSEQETAFNLAFPGRIGRFTNGSRIVILRWVARPTHRVHSAADCLRSAGWRIRPLPLHTTGGERWSVVEAQRGRLRLRVRERCADAAGGQWSDVAAWFWAAVLGRSHGPWWVVTLVESDAAAGTGAAAGHPP